MDSLRKLLLLIPPLVLIASLIEAVVLSRRRPGGFDWRAGGVSLLDLIGRRLLAASGLGISGLLLRSIARHRIATVPLDTAGAFALLFFGQELCYYGYHRAAHRIRWFWNTHSVHHSPNELTLSAAYRIGWMQHLTGGVVFFAPLVWLGFAPEAVLGVLALNLLYQFWLHATWIPRLGWLESVLNTPSAHRVHHASNLDYLDANYGGVLIVFDRLFRTYVPERVEEPCVYGLVKPVTTHAILTIECGPWIALGRDLLAARNLREALGYLFAPPGWRPHGQGETTEALRARRAAVTATSAPAGHAVQPVR